MKVLQRFSIKNRVLFTTVTIVLLSAVFAVLFVVFLNRLYDLRKQEANIESLDKDMILLRVYEGAFFQKDLQSQTFFFDEYSENTASFNDQYQNIVFKVESFDKTFSLKQNKSSRTHNLISNLNEYHDVFFELVGRLREYGNTDYGLVNKLISVQNEIEQIAIHQIKINVVTQRLETLKHYQQDFLESGNLTVLDGFERKVDDLDVVVSAFPSSFFGSSSHKKSFQIKLREYAKWFNLIVKKKKLIGQDSQSGLFVELEENYKKVESDLLALKKFWLQSVKIKRRNLVVASSLFLFFVFLTILGLYLLISTSLITPLRIIQEQVKKLSSGVLPEKLPILNVSDINEIIISLNHFVDGLRAKIDFSKNIGEGNFTSELNLLSGNDQLGASLRDMRDKLLKANEENIRNREEESLRNWLNEGSQKVSNVLRLHSDDLHKLAGKVVHTLVQYLDAVQAGFYSVDSADEELLVLIAAYAYDREKFQKKTFKRGEGLIGVVAVEKEMLHLNKIPENYLELSSTFGVSSPSNLVIIPLVMEEELHGVIEIASFNEFQPHHINLIEKVAKDITSSLASVKINQKTLALLEESEKKSEQLNEKERDIARNLDQLETAKEELQNKEQEAKALLKSVDQDLLRIELDLKARVNEVNKKISESLKADFTEFKGRMLDTFLPTVSEAVFNAKWRKLITENQFFHLETLIKSKASQMWVHLYFFPVIGKGDILTRIQVIGFDLIEFKQRENQLQNKIDEFVASQQQKEDEKLGLKQKIAKLEKEVIAKDIDYQTILIEKKQLEEEHTMLNAENKKVAHQNILKEERITQVRYRLDLIMNTMTIGIIIVSQQGFITFVNNKLVELVVGSTNEIINQKFSETLFAFDPFKLKTSFGYEATLNTKEGGYVDVRVTVIKLEQNDTERLIFVEDLTLQKSRQKEYLEEKERLNNEVSRLHERINYLENELQKFKGEG